MPGSPKLVPYTRCTTFVDCIEDKTALSTWGKRMVLVGAARAPHLLDEAAKLDPHEHAGKRALDRLASTATAIAGAHTKRDQGTHLHALSEAVDLGTPLPAASAPDIADIAAYLSATVHLDVLHVERLVVVDELKTAGTPDRIYSYDGPGPDGERFTGNLIGDLKTGSVELGALKMAMQLALYAHGQFYDHHTGARSPLPDVSQQWGLIIHLPGRDRPMHRVLDRPRPRMAGRPDGATRPGVAQQAQPAHALHPQSGAVERHPCDPRREGVI